MRPYVSLVIKPSPDPTPPKGCRMEAVWDIKKVFEGVGKGDADDKGGEGGPTDQKSRGDRKLELLKNIQANQDDMF